MTVFTLLVSIALLVFSVMLVYLLYKQQQTTNILRPKTADKTGDKLSEIISLDWKVRALLILAIITVLFSFLAPFLFTRTSINKDFDLSLTGQIGDTIGGLMNPFIALSGVVVTGLAFYIQYKANLLQRELFLQEQEANHQQLQDQIDNQNAQIRLQQFESQFYEMLKLHRENISEMKIEGYDFEEHITGLKKFEKTTEGRKIFVVMKTDLECILSLYSKDQLLDRNGFEKCYKLFFSGLEEYEKAYPNERDFIETLRIARRRHERPNERRDGADPIMTNRERKEFVTYAKLYFNYKPFSGHAQRLSHYFRHLYLTVKSVANTDVVENYGDRMKYLRLLRAQLSNHEQIFLFYNWLGGYGRPWEDESNSFFTEYAMIHNLWYNLLFDDKLVSDAVNYLRTKRILFREGPMFEID